MKWGRGVVVASLLAIALSASTAHALPPKIKVLIVSPTDPTQDFVVFDVQSMLQGSGITTVDVFDASQKTPALTDLTKYDAVLLFSQAMYAWKDPVGAGNVMADYVDQGGGVVYFSYLASVSGTTSQLQGRYATSYTMLAPVPESGVATTDVNSTAMLGTVAEPTSPIMKGVKTFACSQFQGPCHYLPSAKQNGAVVTASWDMHGGSAPLVLHNASNSVVEFNLFVANDNDFLGEWDAFSDGATMIANALGFVVGGAVRTNKGLLDFGDQPLGVASSPQDVVFTNTSAVPQTITALTIADGVGGNGGKDYTVVSGTMLPATIAPMKTLTASVTFNPQSAGTRTAVLSATITGITAPVVTQLTGNALGPVLTIMPSALNLGGAMSGTKLTDTVTLSNTGGGTVNISKMAISGDASFTFMSQVPTPFSLTPGATVDVTITYMGSDGAHKASLTVSSNLPDVVVPLTASSGKPMITIANGSLVFPAQHVGVAGAPQTLSIQNGGFSNLTVTGIATMGANAGDFVLSSTLPITILPGMSGTYTLAFKPSVVGGESATVSIASNDPATPSVSYAVAGNGVAFAETVTPASIDFGTVKGGASVTKSVAIANTSTAKLFVQSLTFMGAAASQFSIASPPAVPAAIAAKGTLMLNVVYKPTIGGAAAASLVIGLDDPMMSTVMIPLTGMGTAGTLTISPAKIDFGMQNVGNSTMPQEITLGNTGNDNINIAAVTTTGTNGMDFTVTDVPMTLPYVLAAGATLKMHVTFDPSIDGAETGNVAIMSDDLVMPMAAIPLTGAGQQAGISVTPMELNFGIVPVTTTSKPQTITVSNTGDVDLIVQSVSTTNPAYLPSPNGMFTVKKGGTATIDVTFSPTVVGTIDGMVSINPKDAALVPATVTVRGSGQSTALTVSPTSLTWPITAIGSMTADAMPVTLTNGSTSTVTLGNITSSSPAIFTVDTTMTTMTLAPKASTTFNVSFAPAQKGMASANVNITIKGGTTPAAMVSVSGSAIDGGSGSGCSCAVGGSPPSAEDLLAIAGLCALALLDRRRRRRAAR